MEIMKKFMKFCFVLALILIIAGSALYMLGRGKSGRESMDELLTDFGGDWVNFDVENFGSVASSVAESAGFSELYDINDSSMFDDVHTVWRDNVEKQMIGSGSVDELQLGVGGSMVEIRDSDDGNIYIEGENIGKMQAYVEGEALFVNSVRPSNLMDEIKNSKIVLYLPQDISLQFMQVSLGAGQLKMRDMTVQNMTADVGAGQLSMEKMDIETLELSIGAGELQAKDTRVQNLSASVGMGNLEFSGAIDAAADISCSMGNVSMELEGVKEDFNYELHCVAGNMDIDGEKHTGVEMSKTIDNGADKSIEIDCSMGNVEVDF